MRVIGQERIAEAFGVAPKTIVEWQGAGFPIAVRGTRGIPSEYDLPACITWLVEREKAKLQGESQRDRVYRLQGDEIAQRLAEKAKLLIPADQVEPKWRAACVAAREELLRARRRLVARLEKASTRQARDKAVAEVHAAFLRTLADWRGAGDEPEQAAK
jgi:phage terminase Nu1 subunit (DNA packaging protein)